eukprot:5114441-Alexandrium_andersonii.AAC.1
MRLAVGGERCQVGDLEVAERLDHRRLISKLPAGCGSPVEDIQRRGEAVCLLYTSPSPRD